MVFTLSACYDNAPNTKVYTLNGDVIFKGAITEKSVDETIDLLSNGNTNLRITSEGGANIPAIRLANYIFDNNIKVTFDVQCYSACANYILPSSKNAVVKKGTIVGWHGGAYQEHWEDELESNPDAIARIELWKKKETEIFNKFNIDHNITIYGVLNDFELLKAERHCSKIGEAGNFQGWTYKISDIKRMGIKARFEDEEIPLSYEGVDLQCLIFPFNN